MKVTSRLALSYATAAATVLLACTALGLGAVRATGYVDRTDATYQQVLALQEVRLAALLEGHRLGRGSGVVLADPVDVAASIRVVAAATRHEIELGSVDDEEEAEEIGEFLPRLEALSERIVRHADEGRDVESDLAERDAIIADWLAEETEELELAAQALRIPLQWAAWASIVIGGFGLGLLAVVSRQTVNSIRHALQLLGDGARRIGRGDLLHPVPTGSSDELGELGATLNQVMRDLAASRARVAVLSATLTEQNRQLADAFVEARDANAAKDRFLTTMSHELRTPLNAILGYTELLAEDLAASDSSSVADCRRIIGSGQLLLTLINDVLDIAKISSGQLDLTVEPLDVAVLVADTVNALRPLAHRNRNQLRLALDASGPFVGDSLRLRQIVMNVVGNACKFTADGEISVSCVLKGGLLHFEVRDTGIGIAADKLERIFEPFVQADATTTRRYGGTGLGLAIVKQLVGLMGGNIDVESELGRGSLFRLAVPTAACDGELRHAS